MIRAKARGEAVPTGRRRRRRAAAAAAPPAGQARRQEEIKTAEARPSLVWLGDAGLKELADRLNAEFGAGTVTIVQAGLLVPAEKLVDGRPLPPRPEPDQVRLPRQPPERPLRGLHRGQLPARQHRRTPAS